MSLVEYARDELQRAGLFDEDSDYDGNLGKAALEIVEVFANQGHSGGSAFMVTELVNKLMRYEPLTPITNDPSEWTHVASETWGDKEGVGIWQSKRRPSTFSRDGGQTWYDLDDPSRNNNDVWQRND